MATNPFAVPESLPARLRAAADALEHAHTEAARAAVLREVLACASALQQQIADLRPAASLRHLEPVPAGMPAPVRGDRVLELDDGRQLPVWVFVGEPVEFLGFRDADPRALRVELHNPSQEAYRVHGKLLFHDDAGARIAKHEFVIETLDPLETASQPDAAMLPDGAAAVSVVCIVELAG